MWPSRDGLGVQVSYGLQGGNVYAESLDSEHPWKFAREREGGLALSKVHNSTQRLVPPQISNVEISVSKNDQLNDVLKDIPISLLNQLENSEEFMSSEFIYDPTFGKMIHEGVLRAYRSDKYLDAIAFVTGPTSSTLSLHRLSTVPNNVELPNGEIVEMEVPVFGEGYNFDFNSPIKQVEFCNPFIKGPRHSNTILVRTALSINIMNIETRKHSVNLVHFAEIDPTMLFGESFAWVSACPYKPYQLAAVDVSGNWGVFQISRLANPSLLHSGRIFDSEDFSNFKRISWGIIDKDIIVLSRSYVKTFNLETKEKVDIISAKKWSSIRDYKRVVDDSKFAFLLTSRELVWVDVSNGFKRILVWKHYLDAEDPSLSLVVKSIEGITYASIHSQVHPLVFVFQFKFEDGLPKSIRDPIMIKTDTSTSALDFLLMPATIKNGGGERCVALFKVSTQLEITRMVISTFKDAKLLKHSAYRRNSILKQKQDAGSDKKAALFNNQKAKVVMGLAQEIYEPLDINEDFPHEDAEVFQNYASSLGIDENQEKPPSSLLRISNTIENFNHFDEFDNMMEQLQEYCESKKVSFIPLEKISSHVCGSSLSKITDLYQHLYDLWNKESNSTDSNRFFAKHITKELALSLSITYDQLLEEQELNKRVNKLPKGLKSVVDKWDEGFEQEQEEEIPIQLQETEIPQPIVTVSQSQPSATPASQRLLRPSQKRTSQSLKPSQSLSLRPSQNQSQTLGSSQNISSQLRPKKKKRRITGFG